MKNAIRLLSLLLTCAVLLTLQVAPASAATDDDQTFDYQVPAHWQVVPSKKAHRVTLVDPKVKQQAIIVSYVADPAIDTSPQGVERFKKSVGEAEKALVWGKETDVKIGGEPAVRLDFTNGEQTSSYVLVSHDGHLWIITAVAYGGRTYDTAMRQLMGSIRFR